MMIGGGLLGYQMLLGRAQGQSAEAPLHASDSAAAQIAERGPIIDVHMHAYPQVYVDWGACGWGLPRAEFYAYLGGLMRAGFGQRVMFGSDHMFWVDLIGMSVNAVDSAPFLTPADKRNIFHDNAVRFYRL